MTVQNPPLYLQASDHPAEDFRHLITSTFGGREGVVRGGLTVTGSGVDMTVLVAEGTVLIAGTEGTYQGLYLCHNRGSATLTISAADGSNPRHDLIVAKVEDSDYSGAVDSWSLAVVTGTPAASPAFPAVPDNAFVLATLQVPAGDTVITTGQLTEIHDGASTDTVGTTTLTNYGYAAARGGTIEATSSTRPQSPTRGMKVYERDTDKERVYDGSAWRITSEPYTGKSGKAYATASSTQTLTTATFTKVTLANSVRTPSAWTFSGSGYTPNEAGLYMATASVLWDSNATGIRIIQFYYGASTTIEGVSHLDQDVSAHSNDWVQNLTSVFYIDGTSPVYLYAYQSSGGNLDVKASADVYTHMSLTRIG